MSETQTHRINKFYAYSHTINIGLGYFTFGKSFTQKKGTTWRRGDCCRCGGRRPGTRRTW